MTTERITWRGYDEVRAAEGIARETIDSYTEDDIDRIIAEARAGVMVECDCCGAFCWPTSEGPWHFYDEDCRAVRSEDA